MTGSLAADIGSMDDLALRLQGFAGGSPVLHAFSTRRGGLPPGQGAGNGWTPFLEAGDFPATAKVVRLRQVHGATVQVIRDRTQSREQPAADAAVTRLAGVILTLRTADCIPVLLADPVAPVIAVAHAGWRGTVAGVIERTIQAMLEAGAQPARIQAALGPGIGPCCFQVGDEVVGPFAALDTTLVKERDGRRFIDLQGAVERLLINASVPPAAIRRCSLCTCCRTDLFFSHRGENGKAGRLLSAVALSG